MFSVLMSVYNKDTSLHLEQSVRSIFEQTVVPDEVVLVKDGPLSIELNKTIDNLVSSFPKMLVVALSENVGLACALSEGLKYCSHDIIARMDADDISKQERFEKQLKIFDKNPNVDIVSSWIDEFEDTPIKVVSTRKLPETHEEIYLYAKKRCPINHPVVMFRKDAVLSVGGYLPFPLFEDYYLWIRMLLKGKQFYNIQESLLNFRMSAEMFSRRGGLKYACNEIRLQNRMRELKFISFTRFLQNISVRFIVRILPNQIRGFIYKKQLR